MHLNTVETALPLPGNSGLTITRSVLHRAAVDASDLARQLAQAEYASPSTTANILEECQRAAIRIGHDLGFIFSEPKPFSGARAAQRLGAALENGARRHQADMIAKASGADVWRHRAEVAEEAVRNLSEQLERARADGPALHLIAAE